MLKNIAQLAIAALSIPAQYIKAGRPDMKLPAWGGFQDWSNLVRSSIVWAGLPDLDMRESLKESADDEHHLLQQLIDGFIEINCAVTVGNAIEIADSGAPRHYLPRYLNYRVIGIGH